MSTAQGQLPLFTVPDVRRDCEMRLAALFRDICYQHSIEGCHAGNAWLGRQIGTSADHVRALLRRLVECNLIEIRLDQGHRRTIVPLAPLSTVMRSGWQALCWAVLGRSEFPAPLRRLAEFLTAKRKRREADLTKLGITPEEAKVPRTKTPKNAQKSPEVFGNSSGKSSGLPYKGNPQETATNTAQDKAPTAPVVTQPDPAAVLLLTQSGIMPEAEARLLAGHFARLGAPLASISHAVQVCLRQAEKVTRPGGFLRRAVESAQAGAPYLLPTPSASHASDRGEKPRRVIVAPRPQKASTEAQKASAEAPKPSTEAQKASTEAQNVKPGKETPRTDPPAPASRWETLDPSRQEALLQAALTELVASSPSLIAEQLRRRGLSHGLVIARAKLKADEAQTMPQEAQTMAQEAQTMPQEAGGAA